MTDLEKILLGVGGAGALYGLYNADMFAGLNKSKARGLFNVEEPEHWEELVDETIDEDGEVIRRKTTEVSPSGEERLVSLSPFGRPPNFPKLQFDPEGNKYDYAGARLAGIEPDETGQWLGKDPKTGLILKGRNHKSYGKTVEGEEEAGYEIYKDKDQRYYSRSRPLAELRQAQKLSGAIHPNLHNPEMYMRNRLPFTPPATYNPRRQGLLGGWDEWLGAKEVPGTGRPPHPSLYFGL